jgi:glycosyltransferase involved in cell wall biosynthesis
MPRAAAGDEPFHYAARPQDRLLELLGFVEWLARAAGRTFAEHDRMAILWPRRRASPKGLGMPVPAGHCDRPPVVLLAPIPWHYRIQRPQHLARSLVAAGHPVLYVEGFRRSRLQASPHVVARARSLVVLRVKVPGVVDLYRQPVTSPASERVASSISAGLGRAPAFILAQHPAWAAVALRLRQRWGVPLLYDLIDLHEEFVGAPASLRAAEAGLLEAADAVTATSSGLADHASGRASRVEVVRNGVTLEDFSAAAPVRRSDLARLGYVGALSTWFDVQAAALLARASPNWSLRLAGRVETAEIRRLGRSPKVDLLGEIPYVEVGDLLASLSAVVVPFRDTALTRVTDPVKIYEALAAGLPVVSRRLPGTAVWEEPLVYLVDRLADYPAVVRRALEEDGAAAREARRAAVRGHTWAQRVEALTAVVDDLCGGGQASGSCARASDRETA